MQNTRNKNAFTLVEVLIAVILVGLAIASLVGANISFTRANGAGADLSTAEFLMEQIRELTAMLPAVDPQTEISTFGSEEGTVLASFDDIDDFDNSTFSPPINAARTAMTDFAAFSQQITVQNVSASNFEQVVGDHSSYFVRITVEIFLNSEKISSDSWIRARY
jgi:prepilin-type N-terminal cleavage/methylation domain-containing protein